MSHEENTEIKLVRCEQAIKKSCHQKGCTHYEPHERKKSCALSLCYINITTKCVEVPKEIEKQEVKK